MKQIIIFLISLLASIVYSYSQSYSLELKWASESKLTTSESVLFHESENIVFVANINGNPTDKDNNGFISKVDLDGTIVKLKWAENLNAPKGMGIFKDKLYVTDITRIAEIDLATGKIIQYFEIEGSQFLNDIAVDTKGNVFISDMSTGKIHMLKNNEISEFIAAGNLKSPNGLTIIDGQLYIGTENALFKADLVTGNYDVYIENTGGIDGLKNVKNDTFIISDWQGKIHIIKPGIEKQLLIDTQPQGFNAADFEYINNLNLLIVPTFFDNRVMAYELKY